MAERVHRFKVGQTVDLIPSTFRSATKGIYQIVSLRPIAVKKHLKVSRHNPKGNYWWARDSEGLRKCWTSSTD
jgi:YD repeat-containing protein